jgi:hypothetical protein
MMAEQHCAAEVLNYEQVDIQAALNDLDAVGMEAHSHGAGDARRAA